MAPHFPESVTLESLAWAAAAFAGFILTLWFASVYLPGAIHPGAAAADGIQKQYKLNGLAVFLGIFVLIALDASLGVFSLVFIPRHFFSLLIVANVFALVVSVLLCVQGRRRMFRNVIERPETCRSRGNETLKSFAPKSGSKVQENQSLVTSTPTVNDRTDANGLRRTLADLFFGVEKNPEWFGMDLKMFSYRPSLIGLGLLNASFAFVQYEKHGYLTAQMCLYQLFYFLYLANYFQFEYGMLFTWDIIEERFGWMLVWGDYALVPFFYSIAGWYLIDQLDPLPFVALAGHIALFAYGFWLFRGANGQKHAFKRDPQVRIWGKPADAIGGKLLVSGFWGIGRKLNYTGELCMYASWTLLCGFGSWVPYLLPLLLLCLFVHRAWRDDKRCRAKYGALWNEYCRRARFRMFPYVY